jgi:hypothetical protein
MTTRGDPCRTRRCTGRLTAPVSGGVCARQGTELTGWKSPCQGSAEPKARRRARAPARGDVERTPKPHGRGDAQEPATRGGPPGTSGPGTAKSSSRPRGGLDHAGVHARTVLGLSRGGLQAVRASEDAEANGARRHPSLAAGRRQQRVEEARERGRKARTGGRRVHRRVDRGHAPAPPRERPVAERGGEAAGGAAGRDAPGGDGGLRERGVERGHLRAARARVQRKGGSPGVDGRTVDG